MTEHDPTIHRLIAKHALAGTDAEADMALFHAVPADKQATLIERLKVIDRFQSLGRSGLDEADAAAAELGMTRRNFYRLIARKNELGAVRGLTPRFRTNPAAYPVLAGLTPIAEEVVRRFVATPTDLSIADLEAQIIKKAEAAGETAPTAGTIRRRIEALRRAGYASTDDPKLGRQLLVDQVVVDLPVQYPSGLDKPVATFIVDRETLLILGAALARPDEVGSGLIRAITDLHVRRLSEALKFGLVPLTNRVEAIEWIVDIGLDERIPAVKSCTVNLTASTINVHTPTNRRAGSLVRKLIGDRLGTLPFVLRTKRDNLHSTPAVTLRTAENILNSQVTVWNAQIIERLEQSEWKPQSLTEYGNYVENILGEIFSAFGIAVSEQKTDTLVKEFLTRAIERGDITNGGVFHPPDNN